MTTKQMAAQVAKQSNEIEAICPTCHRTAKQVPDYIRGGKGRLVWECSSCHSGHAGEEYAPALPTRVTQLG